MGGEYNVVEFREWVVQRAGMCAVHVQGGSYDVPGAQTLHESCLVDHGIGRSIHYIRTPLHQAEGLSIQQAAGFGSVRNVS